MQTTKMVTKVHQVLLAVPQVHQVVLQAVVVLHPVQMRMMNTVRPTKERERRRKAKSEVMILKLIGIRIDQKS